jgi:cell division protein FtsI/penicillin-binding protein 2
MRARFCLPIAVLALSLVGPAEGASSKPRAPKAKDADLSSIRTGGGKPPRAPRVGGGDDVAVTIDPRMQRAARLALERSKAPSGAVVMSDVRTGRILVWSAIGKEGDLVRRAKYPAASLFKVVTAATLLEGEHVKPGDVVCFKGGESRLHEGDIVPGCHPGDEHVRFEKALGKSINGVFGRLAAAHLEADRLTTMARAFGLGASPALDLPADATSVVVPEGELGLARAAAGFGSSRMSPLAALDLMQTIANGGERVRLRVTGSPSSVVRTEMGRVLSAETAGKLTRMLEVTTRSGTSAKAFEPLPGKPDVEVAGKTGTLLYDKPKRLVSWFAGFAPSRRPEVAVSVLLANDEKWWKKANEVAREVLDAYFEAKP